MLIPLRAHINRQTLIRFRNHYRSIRDALLSLLPTMSPTHASVAADPPPFDPSQPAVPVSYPIKTLEDLESRSYFDSFHYPFNKSSVAIDPSPLADRPRILVCHDMAGGYTDDDKWVQGGDNADAYGIWHWYLMDVFVYFSHSMVTLPPPCWTNAAHKHGVKVLGTFILEWGDGKIIADKLLSTKESTYMYAERLAELARALGFDGWLINMEVNLDKGQIPNLKEFVSHLTKTMHSSVPGSLVIWYDSVTVDGDLRWQNQLNDKNKPFFDICDGIFVNYSWKEDYPKRSASVAGERKFDVYMGIDVFGRGTYGGGQWTTNAALDVLKRDDVSAALFAPGWVYETKQPPDFETAQNRWWALVEESWGLLQNYPQKLPFYSNFDQGRGYHFSIDGTEVSNAMWNDISSQTLQPFLKYQKDPSSDPIQVLVNFKEASYSGGGSLTFKGTLKDDEYFTTKLFQGKLLLGHLPVHFTYSVKSEGNSLIGLYLEFSSPTEEENTSVLLASRKIPVSANEFSSKFSKVIMPRKVMKQGPADSQWVIFESGIAMNGYTLTEIHAVCYRPPVPKPLHLKLNSNSDGVADPPSREYFAILGHISIKNSEQNSDFPPSTSWLVEGKYIKWSSSPQGLKMVSLKVMWGLKAGNASVFPKYNIFVEKVVKSENGNSGAPEEYLGVAQVEAFYVSNFEVPSGISSLKFIIQVCGADGASQKADESPYFLLSVEG